MTVHLGKIWRFGEPITEEVISQIAYGVKSHNYTTPDAYGIFSLADNFIYNICRFLDKHGKKFTENELETYIPAAAGAQRPEIMEIFRRVLKHLELEPELTPPVELDDEE